MDIKNNRIPTTKPVILRSPKGDEESINDRSFGRHRRPQDDSYLLLVIGICLVIGNWLLVIPSYAAETAQSAPKRELTKQEMVGRIEDNLTNLEEISGFIPGLKKETDATGKNVSYAYNGKKIEDLDKEELTRLYGRISSEAVRVRTDRINRQLAQIRQIEQLSRQNNQIARIPRVPTQPPRIPAPPPRIPRTT